MEHGHQRGGAVDHGGVDHLALAALGRLQQRAHDAVGEVHAAPAEVADQVEGRHRRLALAADVTEGAGQRDVVDVVTGGLGVRALLTPACHAAVDQLGVAGQAVLGTDAQPLGDAGPEALDQGIGLLDQPQHRLDAVRGLEVDPDRPAAAGQQVHGRRVRIAAAHRLRTVDADDVGAHVGQLQRAEREGTQPGQLDDRDARERTTHGAVRYGAK